LLIQVTASARDRYWHKADNTMAGDEQDTEYRLIDGEWQAFLGE
jgi:hypothetical protein